jgi:glycosyltransferase involved in cell wall biosynthesis
MNAGQINLSYVVTTYNKLPYLKIILADLIANSQPDEEIIVTDGASSDGTVVYLQTLFDEGKIDFFSSESDHGEAHGLNKAITASSGILVKFISDDDAFYYPGIRACKEFMLTHPEIDFLSSDGIRYRNNPANPYGPMSSRSLFEKWQKGHTPFAFCGLGIMIRKSSLPLLGYLHTGFIRVDAEYALRVTAGKAKLAWYTGECFAHMLNENSTSLTQKTKMVEEMERLEAAYLGKPMPSRSWKRLRSWTRPLAASLKGVATDNATPNAQTRQEEWQHTYRSAIAQLEKDAIGHTGAFLF